MPHSTDVGFLQNRSGSPEELIRSCKTLAEARNAHRFLVSDPRHESSTILRNLLLEAYARCGDLHLARQIFRDTASKDRFSWNFMIAAYARAGQLQDAEEVFESMPQWDLVASTIMLDAYAKRGHLDRATKAFDAMPAHDQIAWNAMVAAYSQAGEITQCRDFFRRMPSRTFVSWTSMLCACSQVGALQEAIDLFKEMPMRDLVAWNAMLAAQSTAGRLQESKAIFDSMPEWDLASWTALISVLARSDRLQEAEIIFSSMPAHDSIARAAMIDAYALSGRSDLARELFDRSPEKDIVSAAALLAAYALGARFQDAIAIFESMPQCDLVSWATAISSFSRLGDLRSAKALFDRMPERDQVSWNTILGAYSQNGHLEYAYDVFRKMPHHDRITLTEMLYGYASCGRVEEAMAFFSSLPYVDIVAWNIILIAYAQHGHLWYVEELFYQMPEWNSFSWNVILSTYSQRGRLEKARGVFTKMPERNLVSWNCMLSGLASNGHFGEALAILEVMFLRGVEPDEITFTSLILGCSHRGNAEFARDVFRAMKLDHGLEPTKQLYGCMVNLLGRAGYAGFAEDLVTNMPYVPDGRDWTCLLGTEKNGFKGRAVKTALKMEPANAASLVLDVNCVPMMKLLFLVSFLVCAIADEHQPLSKILLHRSSIRLQSSHGIKASPQVLGLKGGNVDYVIVSFYMPSGASNSDWIGIFSPSNFSSSVCSDDQLSPKLCNAPIKYKFANVSGSQYVSTGKGELSFRLINQRQDFAFGLFSGGLDNPVLVAVSSAVAFVNPKAPVSPRIALGKDWDEMTITWTSGYSIDEAKPFVLWGPEEDKDAFRSPAVTITFTKKDVCGAPAKTVGWRDPGYIHTSYLRQLWPSTRYFYRIAHKLKSGEIVYGTENHFTSSPAPGQDSLQRIIIFGDLGKSERDLSNEYNNYQPGSLNTTDRVIEDLDNIDMVFHIGDITYSNGYLSQWDQFTEQIESISSRVPYMIASGNHERDWPLSGSFYNGTDSGGECGVPAQTIFNMPAKNRAKFWYLSDYGMFRFCVADSENDWQEGSEQYKFIEECLSSVDRQKQPWLIFIAHRVLGYSSGSFYAAEGTFAEPMARETFQKLWQKYKVDLAFFGHVHQYERTCPVYQSQCVAGTETENYSGKFNATIHLVVGGGGSHLSDFSPANTTWSLVRDEDFGFGKLTAFDHSTLAFEYKKSSTGVVHDKFWIRREYMDVIGCDSLGNCPEVVFGH